MKKSWIIILVIAVMIIGIICGISIYEKNKGNLKNSNIIKNEINKISEEIIDECTEEYEILEKQAHLDLEANSGEEKISPNCQITLKRYYKECQHTINEYIDIPVNLVNKTQEELQEEYLNWEIKKYSSTEIILYREFESECGQHFILRSVDGKIVIYRINNEMQEEVYEKTEISIDYLTETDKVEIQNGIRVNGLEELNQRIEDFE